MHLKHTRQHEQNNHHNHHKHRKPQSRTRVSLFLGSALAAGLCAADSPQSLQEIALPEIVVTAEFRDISLLNQAASTSVTDAATIAARAAQHLEEILALTPNVNFSGGTSRARYYQIRGVGERSQFVEPLNPSVGLLVNGIDFSGLGAVGTLFDAEQVEILRGPQGTLHGANALAGLINIRTAPPEADQAARLRATVGDYGERTAGLSITGPILDEQLMYRASINKHRSDGYIDNAFLGRSDTNNLDEFSSHVHLRWLPGARHRVDVNLMHIDVDNGYDAFSLDNTRTTLSDEPGHDRQRSSAGGVAWNIEGQTVLTEVMFTLADTDTDYAYDEDWSFVGIAPALEYSSFDRYLRDRRSVSAQARLSSLQPLEFAGLAADWVAGLYYLEDDESLRRRYTFLAGDFTSEYRTRTVAAYTQLDTALTDQLTLSTGLRLARRRMDYNDSNSVTASPENTLWGAKIALEFRYAERGLVYASASRGYRANGVNAGVLSTDPQALSQAGAAGLAGNEFYDEELLWNYEIGHKALFLDGRLSSRLALFYMDRKDQQARGSLVLPRPDGSTAFIDYTDNAASGTNMGLEWEMDWQLSERLQLFASLGLLDAEFDDYVTGLGQDLSGREQAHAPNYQFSTGASYRFGKHWKLRAEIEGKDNFYFSDRHNTTARSTTLGHLRLDYRTPDWTLGLWVRNVTDKDYYVRGFGSFGNDPRKGYAVEPYYQFAAPRRVGVTGEYRF
ncbi:MAG: TonB-dependent receptor [Chromatocurvus sp.]